MTRKSIGWYSVLSLACISVVACSAPPFSEDAEAEVEAPVNRFLAFYFNGYKRGLPEASQLPDLAHFLAPEFLELFEAALRGQDCYAEKENFEGPPPIEGDLFSSLFEGATSATYRVLAQERDAATVEIEWTHDSVLSERPFVWTDQIVLLNTTSGWRIADFAHLGDWEFMMKGNVSQILRQVAEECAV